MPETNLIGLVEVIDSELSDLLAMRGRRFETPSAELYSSMMLAYFGGEIEPLSRLLVDAQKLAELGKWENPSDSKNLYACCLLRLQILKKNLDPALLKALLKTQNEQYQSDPVWRAESLSLIAYAYDLLGDHVSCRDLNLKAHHLLNSVGAKRKAVRMLANHVAAQSRIEPDRHYIPDLLYLMKMARKAREVTTMALTMTHLSREYQRLGAWDVALNYATKAVATSSKNAGNITYYQTLVQRCHVLAQLGCIKEARADYQRSLAGHIPKIRAAVEVLVTEFPALHQHVEETREKGPTPNQLKAMTEFWQDRGGEAAAPPLGKMEQKLISYLSQGARSKREITHHLYGDKISDESADSRLFTLLGRLKKRHPHLIQLVQGRYRLKEDPFLKESQVG